jgi:hypothetical protein
MASLSLISCDELWRLVIFFIQKRRKVAADNAGSRQRRQCALQSKSFGGNDALAENTRKAGGDKVGTQQRKGLKRRRYA